MAAVNCLIEAFLCQELRLRADILLAAHRRGFVTVNLFGWEAGPPDNFGESLERLVEILDQAAGGDVCGKARKTGVSSEVQPECVQLFGELLARVLGGAVAQHGRGGARKTMH